MANEHSITEHESFANPICEEQIYLAGRELSSFLAAVTELYGQDQARLSGKDWLDESELMDAPPLSANRNWRAVTIAASARLANRISPSSAGLNDTKVSPIPTSDCHC